MLRNDEPVRDPRMIEEMRKTGEADAERFSALDTARP